jgi:hypothetical protein
VTVALKLGNNLALTQKVPFVFPNMAFDLRKVIEEPQPR